MMKRKIFALFLIAIFVILLPFLITCNRIKKRQKQILISRNKRKYRRSSTKGNPIDPNAKKKK
jgi:hypothetical protein